VYVLRERAVSLIEPFLKELLPLFIEESGEGYVCFCVKNNLYINYFFFQLVGGELGGKNACIKWTTCK
jgi:hypothetical protein